MAPLRMGGDSGDVLSKVRTIVAQQLAVEESQVVPTASFTQDLGADSLDTVELIMALEEGFNVSSYSNSSTTRSLVVLGAWCLFRLHQPCVCLLRG